MDDVRLRTEIDFNLPMCSLWYGAGCDRSNHLEGFTPPVRFRAYILGLAFRTHPYTRVPYLRGTSAYSHSIRAPSSRIFQRPGKDLVEGVASIYAVLKDRKAPFLESVRVRPVPGNSSKNVNPRGLMEPRFMMVPARLPKERLELAKIHKILPH
jgi:hypothetical protein